MIAEHGMVATSHKRAVEIGIEILKHGGNAIDAAIATNAAMGVVEPMSCGLGGDLYAIVWDAKTHKLYAINASGRSPYATSIDFFRKWGLTEIPTTGPLSWSVPGAVDGWDQLRQKFGTMSWEQLLTPAIECAEQGAEVPKTIGGFFQKAEPELRQYPDSAKTYLVKNGHAPNVGDVFKNPTPCGDLSPDHPRRPRRVLQRADRAADRRLLGEERRAFFAAGFRGSHQHLGRAGQHRPIAACASGRFRRRDRASACCRC